MGSHNFPSPVIVTCNKVHVPKYLYSTYMLGHVTTPIYLTFKLPPSVPRAPPYFLPRHLFVSLQYQSLTLIGKK